MSDTKQLTAENESAESRESRWGVMFKPGERVTVNGKGWKSHIGKNGTVVHYITCGTYFVKLDNLEEIARSQDCMFDFAMLDTAGT